MDTERRPGEPQGGLQELQSHHPSPPGIQNYIYNQLYRIDTVVDNRIQLHTIVYCCIELYTLVYDCIRLYIIVYNSIQLSTIVNKAET